MDIYLLISIIIIVFALLFNRHKLRSVKQLQQSGLENVSLVKQLISLVQQHRGISSAWLNGDQGKRTMLDEQEREISAVCLKIKQTELPKYSVTRWEAFTDHWSRLLRTNEDKNIDNNFKQHTQMIANLLYLLEDEADRCQLTGDALPDLPKIGYVWRELIQTAEIVGQSRAIGTGVATSKVCSSVDKIRLSFLEQHISDTSNKILGQLPTTASGNSAHQGLVKNAKLKMEHLIETIETELIQPTNITIDQNDYFDLATDTISSLNSIFDQQVEQTRSIL